MKKLALNIYKLFPEAARRVEILRELRQSWGTVAGLTLARHSFPCNLGVNTITVAVENQNTANMITRIKGNIKRALILRWKYEADENFTLKIVIGVPQKISRPKNEREKVDTKVEVEIDEESVRQYMQEAPETLPEDINYAVSHLKVFLEKRFSKS